MDVLFGRVRELVLSPAIVSLLNPRVGPKHFDRTDVWLFKCRHLFHVHFTHQLGIILEKGQKQNVNKKRVVFISSYGDVQ